MGERLGRYELVKRLGQGGMAEVFLARQEGVAGFSKELVIKRVLPDLVVDRQFVEMFLDEARLAARLSHPNICQTFELGEVDGQYFIAMERIPGRTLAELIRSAREKKLSVPLPAALRIIGQLCEALGYAHRLVDEHGKPLELVHRDVTPANVMVTPDGSVKLLDFGIARAATRSTRTQVGHTKGKLGFMAPEQITTPQAIDARADLFAMGALLYLLTVGKAPYADTPKQSLMQEMALGRFPPPRQVNPQVPEEIEAIILQAMAPSREARFATAQKVHRALEKAALKLGLSVGPHALRDFLARVDGVATDASVSELIPVPPLPPPPPRSSRPEVATAPATEPRPPPPRSSRPEVATAPAAEPRPPPPAARTEEPVGTHESDEVAVAPEGETRVSKPPPPPDYTRAELRVEEQSPRKEGARRNSKPAQPALDQTRADIGLEDQSTRLIRAHVPAAAPVEKPQPETAPEKPRSSALVIAVPTLLLVVAVVAFIAWPREPQQPDRVDEVKPLGEVVAKPPEKIVAKPPDEVVAKPPDEVVAKPPDEVVAKPPDEVVAKPDEVVAKPPDEVVAKPPDEVVAKPPDEVVAKQPDVKKPPEVKKPLAPKAATPLDMSGPLGTLQVTTTPAAKVSIAGNALGETPLTKQVPVGAHRLRIEYKSGAAHQLLINVVEGRETVVRDIED